MGPKPKKSKEEIAAEKAAKEEEERILQHQLLHLLYPGCAPSIVHSDSVEIRNLA